MNDYPVVYDSARHAAGTISRLPSGRYKARRRVDGFTATKRFTTRMEAVAWIMAGVTECLPMEVER